ncbi:sigma-70 family RNA polymerase sigma factor [Mesoterricola silvestris]|uniref:DNA-directed RNA polymerase sigma-70 factor n=1 Tax=Mesoterricola silvestris TaxID=2927979 RepID=A0AA48K6M6_9BACT|nr:RNA polymerase sigma factor RpoD/SigA [Mesoterricola silvestris]BDU70984.1 DNA-directed RNA polymerase sigma-70 factor [Mesoterricola silvestris]
MPQRHLEERSLDKYFDSIRDLPLLTAEEERINGRLWQNDRNPEGLRMLVEGNLRFVVKEARKFQGMGLDLLDLISEGNLGLIEAAKRFDPERENKFLTYASWWVRQAIFHALAEHGSKIRLPQKVAGHLVQLNRITHRLGQDLGRTPTVADIVAHSTFSAEEVERLQLLQQTTSTVSTEQGMGESDLTLGDSLEQSIEPSAMETLDQESFQDQVRLSLGLLNEKERRIIALHFGLDGSDPMTLERIGQSFEPPISRERVRQIEERAFMKIRERRRVLLGQFLKGDRS